MANNHTTTITAEPGKQEMLITREFDAPRERVFQAFTDPELYVQWLGPRRLTTMLDTFEPRSGGRWRYLQKDQSGNEFGFHGVYHEVRAPECIIDTFEFEGLPQAGHVALETLTLEELPGGRTRLTAQSFSSRSPTAMARSRAAWKKASTIPMSASQNCWKRWSSIAFTKIGETPWEK